MKRKKAVIIPLCAALLLSLASCGNPSSGTEETVGAQLTSAPEATAPAGNTDASPKEEENLTTVSTDRELYEGFLNGTEKVSILKISSALQDVDGSLTGLEADGEYTMDEFFRGFAANRAAYLEEESYPIADMKYAFADCGQDGTEELMLTFTSWEYGDTYTNIMLVKALNGKLEMCCRASGGYRSYASVNADGIILQGGSGGASSWCDYYTTLDAEGNPFLIYYEETTSPYNLDAEYNGDDFAVFQYSFRSYDEFGDGEDSYTDYLNNCDYTYALWNEDGSYDESDEIYEEGSPYREFMDSVSKKVHTPAEMDELLTKRLAGLNLTEEMLQDNEPEWQEWGNSGTSWLISHPVDCQADGVFFSAATEDFLIDESGYDLFIADDSEFSVNVLIEASGEITDFRFWSLLLQSVNDYGEATYDASPVYSQASLTPDRALVIRMSFPGDLPTAGISFVDKYGCARYYSVYLSGVDGSIAVAEEGPF